MATAGRLGRFSFRGADSASRTGKEAAPAAAVVERLPLFSELLQRSADLPRCVVFDLAPASPASIAVLNQIQCRLEIIDLPSVLPALLGSADAAEFRRVLAGVLPSASAPKAHTVLCWDFLNYLPRNAILVLMTELARYCHRDVRIHALMAYSDEMMPAQPCRYTPEGRDAVRLHPKVDAQRSSPRYAPKDLLRCMPGFDMDRAMMLRNGYQEYLLRQAEPSDAPKLRPGDKLPRQAEPVA